MNSVDFIVGDKTYRLSLTTRGIVQLERRLGYNPIMMFVSNINSEISNDDVRIPTTSEMATVLHLAMQRFNHGITPESVYDIIDDYIAMGNTTIDLVPIIVDLFKNSGIMPKDDDEKNA